MSNRNEVKEMYLTTLSKEQCRDIHSAALEILDRTGVTIQCQKAIDILEKAGCKVDGDCVRVPASLVEWALKTVPNEFTLYDQNGSAKHTVGGRKGIFGPGSDCVNILDHRTGQRREPLCSDQIELIKLCDNLENIDFIMSMVIPRDIPSNITDRVQMANMLKYSNKPIIAVSFSYEGTKDILQMAETVAGNEEELRKKPFVIHYIQPVRALVHNEDTVLKFLHTARKGLPCIYLVSAIMGISSPITAAGYQAMGAAGQLAMLVLGQLVREGTPFIVRGGRIVVMDMKTMLPTMADPHNRIFSSEMAHYYDLPCFGTSGVSDSKTLDFQAVAEASMTLMADALVGANLIHDVGYIESGLTYSPELLVMCNEIINWIKAFKQGAPVNADTLALDDIDKHGFNGDFLSTEHTLKHFRQQWSPVGVFDRNNYENWEQQGKIQSINRIHQKIEEILNSKTKIKVSEAANKSLQKIIDQLMASTK